MSKSTKIWLITAASLIVLGCMIFVGGMIMAKWDFSKLVTSKNETNTYEITDAFKNISIKTDTADIKFVLSDDGTCKVVCFEEKNDKHEATVVDDTLTINRVCTKRWYQHIGINIKTPKVTIYLPETEYEALTIKESTGDVDIAKDFTFGSIDISLSTGDVKNYASASGLVKIKASTGDIDIENVSANAFDLAVSTGNINVKIAECKGDMSVKVSTGKAKLCDVSCGNVISTGSTGDITLENVVAEGYFNISRSTGDVTIKKCDASELFVKTDTGDVNGSLLSDKIFFAETDTGSVNVPKSVTGGRCEIKTDTGDIRFEIER
ncbi:MAG: DUF4097 domain-containing protein [Ruminococcaceae bacterium]|nr:DUF4097 domain-containing protein [Oscillospiraceae bacterium]